MTTELENVAKQVGTTQAAIERRVSLILTENKQAWDATGFDESEQSTRAVRIAARQMITEKRKIASSGCVELTGCFVTSPPYKDWAKMAYKKMNTTLSSLDDNGLDALVSGGSIVIYEADGSGFNRKANGSLMSKLPFEQGMSESYVMGLPKGTVEHADLNIHYYIVADNNMPKYPSGDDNYRYGSPRPESEPERTCLFLGSLDGDEARIYEIKFSGEEAVRQQPTFLPGTIPVKGGKDNAKTGNGRAWTRKGVSVFTEDPEAASVLPGAPFALDNGNPSGFLADMLGEEKLLSSFNDLLPYYDAHRDDADWWDQWVGILGEVSHIDTLDNGASTIIVGDLEDFTAPSIEVRVPADQKARIDFSVGSQILVTGAVWKTNDGEPRMSVYGWFVTEGIAPAVEEVSGWDA
tara:strand:+ start:7866 stop:9089 length:1224 start_codon:yes stop_codon:yes gene_type:complete